MLEILVNGQPFTRWETANISRSIDNSTGTFNFTTSSIPNSNFPVRAGDQIVVSVNGNDKIYGFADQVRATGDSTSHTIQVSGRDNTSDLIDCTVPDEAKVVEGPITLRALCEKVILGLGDISITVLDQSGQTNEFSAEELQSSDTGDKCMDFLTTYARKKQVFLIPSGTGNLILFRPGRVNATTPLIHQQNNISNNVKSWEVVKSHQKRFNVYGCVSGDNIGFSANADYTFDGMNRRGQAIDSEIRKSRFFEINAEDSMTDIECAERAKEEANVRRARSTEYTCTVAGFAQLDGTLWDIGQTVTVNDEFAGITGQFLIRSVNYKVDISSGSETSIVCAPLDAYSVQASPTASETRRSDEGTKFSDTADNKQRFKRD